MVSPCTPVNRDGLDGGGLGALLGGRNCRALPRAGPHSYPRPIEHRILRVRGGSGALGGTCGGVRTPEASRDVAPLPCRGPRRKFSIVGDDPERDHARWLLLGRPSGRRNVRAHARARRILSPPSLEPIAASMAPPKPPASPPRMPRTVKAGSAPRRPSSPELLGPRGASASGQGPPKPRASLPCPLLRHPNLLSRSSGRPETAERAFPPGALGALQQRSKALSRLCSWTRLAANYVLAGRVLHVGSIIMAHAVR